eukprot:464170-Amphidinium_carterae.1
MAQLSTSMYVRSKCCIMVLILVCKTVNLVKVDHNLFGEEENMYKRGFLDKRASSGSESWKRRGLGYSLLSRRASWNLNHVTSSFGPAAQQ